MVKVIFYEKPGCGGNKKQKAIEDAESIAASKGGTSAECLDAWHLVDDLEAEVAYQEGSPSPEKTSFQEFCDEHPEVLEIRHHQMVTA